MDPSYVIFSAGHKYGHPRATTAARYLAHGVDSGHILRTDRGDDDDGQYGHLEWKEGSITGQEDEPGDDDVDILIRATGELLVEYRNQ